MEEHQVSAVPIKERDRAIVTWAADVHVELRDLALVLFELSKRGGKSWYRGRLATNIRQRQEQLGRFLTSLLRGLHRQLHNQFFILELSEFR